MKLVIEESEVFKGWYVLYRKWLWFKWFVSMHESHEDAYVRKRNMEIGVYNG